MGAWNGQDGSREQTLAASMALLGPMGLPFAPALLNMSGKKAGLYAMKKRMEEEEAAQADIDRRQRARMARMLGEVGGAGEQAMNVSAGAREGVDQTAQELAPLAQAMGGAQGLSPAAAQRMALAVAGDSRLAAMQRAMGLEGDRQQLATFGAMTDINELRQERQRRLSELNAALAVAGRRGANRRMMGEFTMGVMPLVGQTAGMAAGMKGA